ncbi:hypothetical protein BU15DRAFT_67472 [Melanogaster broomeanus]|nr:hypothetical protein BU15DRAFT_67472 [Melanogaster broomeanus]
MSFAVRRRASLKYRREEVKSWQGVIIAGSIEAPTSHLGPEFGKGVFFLHAVKEGEGKIRPHFTKINEVWLNADALNAPTKGSETLVGCPSDGSSGWRVTSTGAVRSDVFTLGLVRSGERDVDIESKGVATPREGPDTTDEVDGRSVLDPSQSRRNRIHLHVAGTPVASLFVPETRRPPKGDRCPVRDKGAGVDVAAAVNDEGGKDVVEVTAVEVGPNACADGVMGGAVGGKAAAVLPGRLCGDVGLSGGGLRICMA